MVRATRRVLSWARAERADASIALTIQFAEEVDQG